jgi:hypothetical protein
MKANGLVNPNPNPKMVAEGEFHCFETKIKKNGAA